MTPFTESDVEDAALAWLEAIGWRVGHGSEIAPDMPLSERADYGELLGLTEEELAFYDALETNDSAVRVLGEPTLRQIAQELVQTLRNDVTIDWTVRESACANLRRLVKRTLRKHGYPPDKQEKTTQTVLEQAEALSAEKAYS